MARMKVAFAGCGRISDLHAIAYLGNPEAELYALCDRDLAVAGKRAAEWGVRRVVESFEDLISDHGLDAVEILTPQSFHEPMAIKALEAGKHVSVQKPMTTSLASADRMIAAAKRSGKILKVSENYVFYPPLLLAKRLIDEGAIGEPMTLRIKMMSGGSGGWAINDSTWAWRLREYAEGRGMNTFDHGHHMWAAAWSLLGQFEKVEAWVDEINGIIDSPAVVMWKHRSSRRYGQCEFQYGKDLAVPSSYYANDEWFDVSGSRGILVVNRCTANIKDGPAVSVYSEGRWRHYEAETDWAAGFVGSTRNFVDAILGRDAARLDAAQARHILAMDLAVAKSDRERRAVWVNELDAPFPRLYAVSRRRAERKAKKAFAASLSRGGDSGSASSGSRVRELTLGLASRFQATAAAGFEGDIGIVLTDGGADCGPFTLGIRSQVLRVSEGSVPENAILVLRASKGAWASILLGKARIETSYLGGKLRIEGEVAQALRLRDIFGL